MILKEKHYKMLDKMPLGKWIHIHKIDKPKGVTGGTFRALFNYGLVDLCKTTDNYIVNDDDVKQGFVKVAITKYEPEHHLWNDYFVKKLSNNYRGRDYEMELLKAQLQKAEQKLALLEKEQVKS